MTVRLFIALLALFFLFGILCGCTGKRSFLMVQLCLGNEKNVQQFIDTMKSISLSQHMEYGDRSADTQQEFITLGIKQNYPVMNIGAAREDGMGWGAGDLSKYEVFLGFTEGSNPAEAHRFADLVIKELNKKWRVYYVPVGRGAMPRKACHGQSGAPPAST